VFARTARCDVAHEVSISCIPVGLVGRGIGLVLVRVQHGEELLKTIMGERERAVGREKERENT